MRVLYSKSKRLVAINMYCDRILSIFPNGTLKLVNYSKLKEGDYAAKLMEGVSPSVPMRSGVLGVFAIVAGVLRIRGTGTV